MQRRNKHLENQGEVTHISVTDRGFKVANCQFCIYILQSDLQLWVGIEYDVIFCECNIIFCRQSYGVTIDTYQQGR